MRGRGVSLGAIYLIAGLVVAAAKDYFDNIESFKGVLEALIAIIICRRSCSASTSTCAGSC